MQICEENLITPCYVIHKNIIDVNLENFYNKVKEIHANSILSYSYKTNYYPFIIKSARNNRYWAEVTSEDEYNMAKNIGHFQDIIYNGPQKEKNSFLEAMNNGCLVNIESYREVEWLDLLNKTKEYTVGIRVNYYLNNYCEEKNDREFTSRFGFSYENGELQQIINRIHKKGNIRINCFHMHKSGNSRSVNIYKGIINAALSISKNCGIKLEYIDVGGGFKLGVQSELTVKTYIKGMQEELKKHSAEKIGLILEPGNSIVYQAIDYVTTVIDKKIINNKRFVVIDGSRIHIDPLFHRSEYANVEIRRVGCYNKNESYDNWMLCGCTCKETDRILKLYTNEINYGDKVWIKQIGSYTMSLIPHFILSVPHVYIEEHGNYKIDNEKIQLNNLEWFKEVKNYDRTKY